MSRGYSDRVGRAKMALRRMGETPMPHFGITSSPNAQAMQEELEYYRAERDEIRLTEMSRRMRELHEDLDNPGNSPE